MRKITYYFLIFFIFSLPWQAFVFIPGVGSISRLLGIILLVTVLLYIVLNKKFKEANVLIIVSILFFIWGLFSYLWSINQIATLSRFITNIQLLAIVWIIWELCETRDEYSILLQAFILGLFISIGDMIYTYMYQTGSSYRISAGGFNPNRIAVYLAFGIPISWYLVLTKRTTLLTYINIIYIPLSIFSILLTASRTGLVVGIIGLSIIPLTFFYLRSSQRIIFLLLSIVCIIFVLVFQSDIMTRLQRNVDRLATTTESVQEGQFSYRGVIWKVGIQKFKERPLHGYGSRSSRFVIGEELVSGRDEFATHSAYVAILLDTGIIGMLLFILIFLAMIIQAMNLRNIGFLFQLIILCALIVSMIPSNLETDKTVWFLIAISMQGAYILMNGGSIKIIRRE
jgi:O-antigen ligase